MKPLLLLLALYALTASAVPAKRERYTLKLHDGSTIEATLTGNEALHYYLTDDGKYLQCDNKGIAHFVEPDILEQRWQAKIERRKAVRKRFANKPRSASRVPMTGSKRGLVILVQFPQTAFHYTYTSGVPFLIILSGVIDLMIALYIVIFRRHLEPDLTTEHA